MENEEYELESPSLEVFRHFVEELEADTVYASIDTDQYVQGLCQKNDHG